MSNLSVVEFHNQSIQVLMHESKPYVAMRSIVENIGLDWAAQYSRIKRHPILNKGVVMITTPSKGGKQDFLCLPLSMLNGWLLGVDVNKVKIEIRETLTQYQLECFDVLYRHFTQKPQGDSYLPSIVARATEAGLQVASQIAASMSDQVHNLSMSKRFFVNIDMHDKKVYVRDMTDDETLMKFTEMDDLLKPLLDFYQKREIGSRAPRIRKAITA